MGEAMTGVDWAIVLAYLTAVVCVGVALSRRRSQSAADYFRGGNEMSAWVVTFSVIATTQSAATFLGGPDYGYRGDYTYLGSFLGSAMAATFVARFIVPRFYDLNVTTVYELLEVRYGPTAKRAAGVTYLMGRVFANGARLYMAAIAVSMMLFFDIEPGHVVAAVVSLTVISLGVTLVGGIRSVIWSDFAQFIVYFAAAAVALVSLASQLALSPGEIVDALKSTPEGVDKLKVFDFSADLAKPFGFWAVITGVFLLNVGNFGFDQDTTQRLLTCRDAKAGGRALVWSALAAVPIVWVFVTIGQLLYLYYDRPDVGRSGSADGPLHEFSGEKITIFMSYILTQMPPGVRGLAVVGVIAAAVSTMTSGINAMSSVLIEDFYRPWRERRKVVPASHFVDAGRAGMGLFSGLLAGTAVLSFYWQRYANTPLLEFALSVMAFAYAGLVGVFFTAIFSNRGSPASVVAALVAGFIVILTQQPYVIDLVGLPAELKNVSFPWQLIIGATVASLVCMTGGKRSERLEASYER
jgi:Na+/proline symporter